MAKLTRQEFEQGWKAKTGQEPEPGPEPQEEEEGLRPLLSDDVQQWPEYLALMQRLGVAVQTPFVNLTLKIIQGELIVVKCECLVVDMGDSDAG